MQDDEERIFYINMCINERFSKRELERQIDRGYYERYMFSQKPIKPAIEEARKADYMLDFLDVAETVEKQRINQNYSVCIIYNTAHFLLKISIISLCIFFNIAVLSVIVEKM